MYTYEQRMTAVKLYIKYYHKAGAVIRELGYPNRHMLVKWFEELGLLQLVKYGSRRKYRLSK